MDSPSKNTEDQEISPGDKIQVEVYNFEQGCVLVTFGGLLQNIA